MAAPSLLSLSPSVGLAGGPARALQPPGPGLTGVGRALKPPGYRREWHVGVRAEKSGKLVGFITGIPATVRAWAE